MKYSDLKFDETTKDASGEKAKLHKIFVEVKDIKQGEGLTLSNNNGRSILLRDLMIEIDYSFTEYGNKRNFPLGIDNVKLVASDKNYDSSGNSENNEKADPSVDRREIFKSWSDCSIELGKGQSLLFNWYPKHDELMTDFRAYITIQLN